MARREARELTLEEFDDWRAATDKFEAIARKVRLDRSSR